MLKALMMSLMIWFMILSIFIKRLWTTWILIKQKKQNNLDALTQNFSKKVEKFPGKKSVIFQEIVVFLFKIDFVINI